jgi:hypothetical protein
MTITLTVLLLTPLAIVAGEPSLAAEETAPLASIEQRERAIEPLTKKKQP